LQPQCGAILALFDSDDDCPKELAPVIREWARSEAADIAGQLPAADRLHQPIVPPRQGVSAGK
jgi:hypothetical protein